MMLLVYLVVYVLTVYFMFLVFDRLVRFIIMW
jgi:hypothetical protein